MLFACALALAAASSVRAQPGSVARQLDQATQALRQGDYRSAQGLAAPIAHTVQDIAKQDRAEAWRIYGLALYFDKRHGDAERAFFEYLKLDPNAHLEPSLVPPEAIVFFESVRTRHAAELHKYRPKTKTKRRWLLNWLPPAGQFQNGHKVKGAIIGVVGALLLATNITTYFVLRDWCDNQTGVCRNASGDDLRSRAKNMRMLNLASAGAFAAVYSYAVIDGLIFFRRARTTKHVSVGVVPAPEGAYLSLSGRF